MGIDISAKLIYGMYVEDIESEGNDPEKAIEAAENDDIDYASPYYDSPSSEWLIGVHVFPTDLVDGTIDLKDLDKELLEYGITKPQLIVSPHVW